MVFVFKEGFPNKTSTNELESSITEIQKAMTGNFPKQLLIGHIAAIDSALTEIERRRARKTTNFTLMLSALSLFIAGGAFLFSFLDYVGDKSWQDNQIDSLEKIQANTEILQKPQQVAQ